MVVKWTQLNKKGLEKVTSIGKAAAKLFNEKGYLETSMEEIATAANVSKGGIYHYFPSKHGILYFILTDYMDSMLKILEKDLQKVEDGLPKIKRIISAHIEFYRKNVAESKILLHEAQFLPLKY